MGETIKAFGLDWPPFLAQVLVFLIVFFILKAKAFGPIQGMLAQRRQRIEEGEENLKKIAADLANAEATAREIREKANADAEAKISSAQGNAQRAADKITAEAQAEATNIKAKAHEATELERDKAMAELRRDFGRLVVDTTSKVTGKVLSKKDHESINEETAAQIAL